MRPIEIMAELLKLNLATGTRLGWREIWIVVLDERTVLIGGKYGLFFCSISVFLRWCHFFQIDE